MILQAVSLLLFLCYRGLRNFSEVLGYTILQLEQETSGRGTGDDLSQSHTQSRGCPYAASG